MELKKNEVWGYGVFVMQTTDLATELKAAQVMDKLSVPFGINFPDFPGVVVCVLTFTPEDQKEVYEVMVDNGIVCVLPSERAIINAKYKDLIMKGYNDKVRS